MTTQLPVRLTTAAVNAAGFGIVWVALLRLLVHIDRLMRGQVGAVPVPDPGDIIEFTQGA